MTTWRQIEYEKVLDEIRQQEEKKLRKKGVRSRRRELKVTRTMANHPDMLTENELHNVTSVFRSMEKNTEEDGTILPEDIPKAMRSLGLNPSEQEVIDIPNYITRKGLIFFSDFCKLVLSWFREEPSQEEHFKQNMFRVRVLRDFILFIQILLQVMCGTDPYKKEFKAKKYKLEKHFISKVK